MYGVVKASVKRKLENDFNNATVYTRCSNGASFTRSGRFHYGRRWLKITLNNARIDVIDGARIFLPFNWTLVPAIESLVGAKSTSRINSLPFVFDVKSCRVVHAFLSTVRIKRRKTTRLTITRVRLEPNNYRRWFFESRVNSSLEKHEPGKDKWQLTIIHGCTCNHVITLRCESWPSIVVLATPTCIQDGLRTETTGFAL